MKKFKVSFLPKKNYLRLLLSYTGIVVCSVVMISSVLLTVYNKMFSESLDNLNAATLADAKLRLETEVLRDINFLSLKISSMQYEYVGFDSLYASAGDVENAQIMSFIKHLNNDVRQRMDIISSIHIYFPANDLFISSNGFYRNYSTLTEESSLPITYPIDYNRFVSSSNSFAWTAMESGSYPLSYLRKSPYGFDDYSTHAGVLRINLTENAIKSIILNDDVRTTLLYDTNANTVLYPVASKQAVAADATLAHSDAFARFLQDGTDVSFQAELDGQKMHITCTKVKDYSLALISMIPEAYFYQPLQTIRQRAYLICSFALFIGLLVAFLVTSSVYQPLHKLLKKIISFSPASPAAKPAFDEYKILNRSVDAMSSKIQSLDSSLKNFLPAICNNFFSGLLLGNLKSPVLIDENLSMLDFRIIKPELQLIVIAFHSISGQTEQEEYVRFYRLFTFVESLGTDTCKLRVVNFQNTQLVVFLQCDDADPALQELPQTIAAYARQLPSATTIVSRKLFDILDAPAAYGQISALLQYSYFVPLGDIIIYEDFAEQADLAQEFPQWCTDTFSQALYAESLVALQALFVKLEQMLHLPMEYSISACFALLRGYEETMRRFIAGKLFSDFHLTYETYQRERLSCTHSFVEWQAAMLCLAQEVFEALQNKNVNKNYEKMSFVKNYIAENIVGDLSLGALAQQLGMSPQYLSKVFKDIEGINIVQYVSEFRLQLSCQMLDSTNKNINQIANALGFSSTAYFISTFKKRYGTTPRDYRDTKFNKQP